MDTPTGKVIEWLHEEQDLFHELETYGYKIRFDGDLRPAHDPEAKLIPCDIIIYREA